MSDNPSVLSLKREEGQLKMDFIEIKNGVTPILKINNQDTSGSLNGETFNVSFNIDDSNSSIIYEVINNDLVWNNLDDGKLLGSGNISGAVRYDNTPPEIKEIALLSSNPGENKDDYPQLDNKHTQDFLRTTTH